MRGRLLSVGIAFLVAAPAAQGYVEAPYSLGQVCKESTNIVVVEVSRVNKDKGVSKKYGIEIEPLLISGGALNMQALLAGSIQMSQNSASSALQAFSRWQ